MPTNPSASKHEIRPLTALDVQRGMDLVREAGWNQTCEDWQLFLRFGRCFGIDDRPGHVVATSAILAYPPACAWIGMILVDSAWRRRGFASRLLDYAISNVLGEGLVPMLDATPDGREVYRRMGFTDVASISRWRGLAQGGSLNETSESTDAATLASGIAADEIAFGASRATMLANLSARPGALTLSNDEAMLWSRAGRTATQIGPLLASSEAHALTLCSSALKRIRGPIMLDVPDRETAMASTLSAHGFVVERSFTRMARGSPPSSTLGADIRVIAGPELG